MPGIGWSSPPSRAGTLPAADPRLLTGVLFGQLGAAPEAKAFYSDLTRAAEFSSTAAWAGLDPAAFDGLAPTRPGRLGCPPGRAPCPGLRRGRGRGH